MSSSKALASLTATYTDSENEDGDNRDETAMELESDEESKVEGPEAVEEIDDDLPPEPTGTCAPELQDKVTKMLYKVQNEGLDVNREIQAKKSFRNPSIYEKLIDYCGLNEFGTNYPAHIYDPFKWGKESYYDELAKVQKIEMDKRDKERKEKTKVEIVSGTAKKVAATNGSSNISVVTLDGEKRRKTKWDQIGSTASIR